MKEQKKEMGITLVALVVTIIILLILAGVTLNIALSENGIFNKAKEAVEKYKQAEEDEGDAIEKLVGQFEDVNIDYNDYVGAYVEGYKSDIKQITITPTTSGVKSSDSAGNKNMDENGNQTFETETDMKWRIWDYDGTTIRLISERPTNATLSLKGAAGYNNGVWAINEICRQCYGQYDINGEMKNGICVASLKVSDIKKVIKYDYTKYSHNGKDSEGKEVDDDVGENGKYRYGSTKEYEIKSYPKMWEKDKEWSYSINQNESDKEGLIWEQENTKDGNVIGFENVNSKIEFKQSYFRHDFNNSEADPNEWKNPKYWELVFGNDKDSRKHYWLATRSTNMWDWGINFSIRYIYDSKTFCSLPGNGLCGSTGAEYTTCVYSLRPVISINLTSSGFELEKIVKNDGKEVSFSLKKGNE